MLSVVPRVKMISSALPAPRICRHALRATSRTLSRSGTQFVEAAMNVGVVVLIIIPERIDDRARLLRCRRVIKIDERMTVHFLMEDRKILPDDTPIDFVLRGLVHDQAICAHVARCATFFAQRKNALLERGLSAANLLLRPGFVVVKLFPRRIPGLCPLVT